MKRFKYFVSQIRRIANTYFLLVPQNPCMDCVLIYNLSINKNLLYDLRVEWVILVALFNLLYPTRSRG
jgi:hypothetical protein